MRSILLFIALSSILSFTGHSSELSRDGLPRLKFLEKIRIKGLIARENGTLENHKAHAIGMAVLLGPFGMHRIYLGTETHVPVIYCVTLGGGLGVLPVTDIIAILITPELDPYLDNGQVIMWLQ